MKLPIIDIFAGPGGLGEGFSSVIDSNGNRPFKIALSVEMERFAHQTLTLRSFYRQFLYTDNKEIPEDYYNYLAGYIRKEELFARYPEEAHAACNEAINATLGDEKNFHHESFFDKKITQKLKGRRDWILIGGPPCQAYSLVGRARRTGGGATEEETKEKLTEFEKDPKHKLYQQYLRIIARHSPAVFIMENVKGILSAQHEGSLIFPRILDDLHNPRQAIRGKWNGSGYHDEEYNVFSFFTKDLKSYDDFIIRSEDYGIPQARHRVILLGIRKDFLIKCNNFRQVLKKSSKENMNVHNAIYDLPALRSGLSKTKDGTAEWQNVVKSIPSQSWFSELTEEIKDGLLDVVAHIDKYKFRESNRLTGKIVSPKIDWYRDPELKSICNHDTRAHIREDIYRYAFVSCFGKIKGVSPKLADFPRELLPKHRNVKEGVTEAKFADRFRVQVATKPSTTVTCHISKDGHYFIHPDPRQVRSLTVREAARLQTFPDNYFFEGPRTAQYQQVGNAVPPYLAYQIGKIVARLYGIKLKEDD